MTLHSYLNRNEIRCPHCQEVYWKSGEDSWKEVNILLQLNCPLMPFECPHCEEYFFVKSHIIFEAVPDNPALEQEFSTSSRLTRLENHDKIV
jgi:hypothetical protein